MFNFTISKNSNDNHGFDDNYDVSGQIYYDLTANKIVIGTINIVPIIKSFVLVRTIFAFSC